MITDYYIVSILESVGIIIRSQVRKPEKSHIVFFTAYHNTVEYEIITPIV